MYPTYPDQTKLKRISKEAEFTNNLEKFLKLIQTSASFT